MPFDVVTRDGVLTLTLDTPGSPINVFNHATARQLTGILADVTPANTRAIVFETAKPNSFINGVGLLLAHASQSQTDIIRASTPAWTAYQAVRDAAVPTVAVIQGNCFGCGVEFALSCDYRIASDSCETVFYMTELNDYLFIPLFGGTWNLPEAVGLSDAIDLLLWGQRWDAQTAWERGLIDEVAPYEKLADRRQGFVQRVLDGRQPSRRRVRVGWEAREDAVMAAARQRIESLPPPYRRVYTDALDLLEAGARQGRSYADHQRQEAVSSANSALSPLGKAAYGFFYLRQMASERAAGRARNGAVAPARLCVDVDGAPGVQEFANDLRSRRLPGVAFGDAEEAEFRLVAARSAFVPPACGEMGAAVGGGSASVFDVPPAGGGSDRSYCRDVAVQVCLASGPGSDIELYAPTYAAGGRLIELATRRASRPDLETDGTERLVRTLQRFGFEVARTSVSSTFVSQRLLIAFWAPLMRCVERDDDVGALNGQLRSAGFVQPPHALVAALGGPRLARHLAPVLRRAPAELEPLLATLESPRCSDGGADAPLIDALCISLLEAVLAVRAAREVRDMAVVDLIARELLDFPRHLCSLCAWLKTDRVARAIAGSPRVGSLVSDAALAAARTFVVEGREFYR
jgi:enoyl-CoA hydratase/carnithine racemase